MMSLRETIVGLALKHLRESYYGVDRKTIFTDRIYSAFFRSSLEQTEEDAGATSTIGRECRKLIQEIEEKQTPIKPTPKANRRKK